MLNSVFAGCSLLIEAGRAPLFDRPDGAPEPCALPEVNPQPLVVAPNYFAGRGQPIWHYNFKQRRNSIGGLHGETSTQFRKRSDCARDLCISENDLSEFD
jgi:hypothetical protein